MAAPLGFKTFATGDVLTAADTNGYLMQGVWTFASAAARDAAVTSPQEGNFCFLKDTNVTQYYDGAAWTPVVSTSGNTFYAGKNKVINGALNVWQRGTTFTNIGAGSYCADRFIETHDGTGLATVTQQTFTPGTAPVAGYEGSFFLRDALTVTGTSTYIQVNNRIEDVRSFAGQTVTLSFWAKADSARTSLVYVSQNFGSGGSGAVFGSTPAITYSTAWQRFSFTLSMASIAGKTIGTGSFLEIGIRSTATSGSVLDIWGLQLEAGSTATDFQTASGSLGGELALCQRYYFRNGPGIVYGSYGIGIANSTTICYGQIFLPVTMRTAPTAIDFSTLGLYDATTPTAVTSASIGGGIVSSPNVAQISLNVAAGLVQYRPYQITNLNSSSGYIGFSAEL